MKDISCIDELTRDEAEQLEKVLDREKTEIPFSEGALQNKVLKQMYENADLQHAESVKKDSHASTPNFASGDEIKSEKSEQAFKPKRHRKRRGLILIAAIVMLMGTVALAASNDWDIQMAERLGLSSVMEKLEGGYVVIGETQSQGDITMTVTQAIGDSSCQWIEIDTNIPWEANEEEAYGVEDCTLKVYPCVPAIKPDGQGGFDSFSNFALQFLTEKSGGYTVYCYEKDGNISIMISAMDYEDLNRSLIQVEIKDLGLYHGEEDGEGTVICDSTFRFSWKNYYNANTKHIKLNQEITLQNDQGEVFDCTLTKLEVTPISLRLEAKAKNVGNGSFLYIDSIKMKDGTVIPCGDITSGGVSSVGIHSDLEGFLSLVEEKGADSEESSAFSLIDGTQIESITVGGVEISIDD